MTTNNVSSQKISRIFGITLLGFIFALSTVGFAPVAQADGGLDSGGFDWGTYDYTPSADTGCWDCGSGGFDWGTYDYTPSDSCWDCYGYSDPNYYYDDYGYDYGYDDYYYDDYSYGGGYSMPSFSFPTYSKPSGGGGYYSVTPRSYTPVTVSGGGGSQTQNQSQNQDTNVSVNNENTNVNINNNTAIAVAQVQLGGQGSYQTPNYPTYPAPYCTINQAQYGGYSYGSRAVYLSWNSSNAQSAYLSNYGSVAVNGSQTVYPTYTTTYTLTVYGYNGQQATCQTTVNVNTYVPPTYTPTPYVSLTQIPYTGFDFGTFGNAMYFAAIAIVALGGAYLTVYFIPQLAFARSSFKRTFAPVVAPKAPILLEKEAAEAKVQPIVASIKKGTSDTMAIVQAKGSLPKIVIDRS